MCEQGEDDVLPMVSLPRVALEKNPFTTTLVAFPSKGSTISGGNDARQFGSASPLHWSHSVAFEVRRECAQLVLQTDCKTIQFLPCKLKLVLRSCWNFVWMCSGWQLWKWHC